MNPMGLVLIGLGIAVMCLGAVVIWGGYREMVKLEPCAIETRPTSPAGLWSCDPRTGEWTLLAESKSGQMYPPMRPFNSSLR